MSLENLGYQPDHDAYRKENGLEAFDVGRVVAEHKERYVVRTSEGEFDAEVTGNLRFTASGRYDFPTVGDWVALSVFDESLAMIHKVFPRKTLLERQAVGKFGEKQLIATNIDYAIIVQAADRDFNINRLERYLTICHSAEVRPIIVLSKIDLIDPIEMEKLLEEIRSRIEQVPLLAISNHSQAGYEQLQSILKQGKTYCFLGSSGVGKSTLINNLSGKEVMKTLTISESTKKGRHTTSHRELVVLENGAILIDNPGMREIGLADTSKGLEITFESIFQLANDCKFSDCTHMHEKGCAVRSAVEDGQLDEATYNNFLKMERENEHFQSNLAEKRKKDKAFGKMVKEVKKRKKREKF